MNESSHGGRESDEDDVKFQTGVMFNGDAAGTDRLAVEPMFAPPAYSGDCSGEEEGDAIPPSEFLRHEEQMSKSKTGGQRHGSFT